MTLFLTFVFSILITIISFGLSYVMYYIGIKTEKTYCKECNKWFKPLCYINNSNILCMHIKQLIDEERKKHEDNPYDWDTGPSLGDDIDW